MHYRNSSVDFCAYVILSKHPHFAAGGQFRTQARKSGVRGSGTQGLTSLPLPPLASRSPQPRFLGPVSLETLSSGGAPHQTSRISRAHGLEWTEPSTQGHGTKNWAVCCVLLRSPQEHTHTAAQGRRHRGLRSGPDSRASKRPAATASWRPCLEGISGKPIFNLEVVWFSQNFWNVLGALETYCSFYKQRHLAFKRDVFSISQHCGGLLTYMSVSEGEKYLSGQTPRVHPERPTLEVKPELNLLMV